MRSTVWFCALSSILAGCGDTGLREPGSPDAQPFEAQEAGSAVSARDDTAASSVAVQTPPTAAPRFNTESYDTVTENGFLSPLNHPLSTFSIDVDTASYANVRRFLHEGVLPPAGAVRIEELINYFTYQYDAPEDEHPFAVQIETARCPWQPEHLLTRVGLQGATPHPDERPDANLVFLLDVSGSMNSPNKLPLVKSAMRMLVEELRPGDRIAIVVYAGASGLVLPSTPVGDGLTVLNALDRLKAGGSTNGGEGIQLAYRVAAANRISGGINRVILCSDGDFNVGITSRSQLVELIRRESERRIFLSVFGFGTGNLKDATMEELSNRGNGTYGYIDSLREARRIFVEELPGTLVTIAQDVKIQIDFNPRHVQAYRLIGYENRMLAAEDFRDDRRDAGEIGAGHRVTALYEIVPHGVRNPVPAIEPSRYQSVQISVDNASTQLLTARLRYRLPEQSEGIEFHVPAELPTEPASGSGDFQFAASVALFGQLLRQSAYTGDADWSLVETLAAAGNHTGRDGRRDEFQQLVRIAAGIDSRDLRGLPSTAALR